MLRCGRNADFLSPGLITLNYKKMDSLYQRLADPHSIDYRLLMHNRSSTLTPAKHSQVTPALSAKAQDREKKRSSFASHRILDF